MSPEPASTSDIMAEYDGVAVDIETLMETKTLYKTHGKLWYAKPFGGRSAKQRVVRLG
jgi:hypothetical protein